VRVKRCAAYPGQPESDRQSGSREAQHSLRNVRAGPS
jgi:hypothetical protein